MLKWVDSSTCKIAHTPVDVLRNVDVRAGTIGVLNAEHSPMLAGFLMAFHKLAYFFLLIGFLARVIKHGRLC